MRVAEAVIERACARCGKRLASYNRSGYCREHVTRGKHGGGACACGTQLGLHNHTGRCRRCAQDFTGRPFGPRWKGGRVISHNGYVRVRKTNHPRTDSTGYVLEHILVVEVALGRHLAPGECVHHINRKRSDNRTENLAVFASKVAHARHHASGSTDGLVWSGDEATLRTPALAEAAS